MGIGYTVNKKHAHKDSVQKMKIEAKHKREAGSYEKSGRGFRIFRRILLGIVIAILAVLLTGVSILGIAYLRTDYSADEQLFEMAKGARTTRFFYNTAEHFPAGIGESSLPSRLKDLQLYPEKNTKDGILKGYIAAEIEGQSVSGGEKSIWCSYEDIPVHLRNAFVAIEDKRFFLHDGVDWSRTLQAAVNCVFRYDDRFGGSTITQQLIKNISADSEITIARKLREICRAIHLESHHSKEEILELYLNVVPMSQGCIGVGAAAARYYGKDVQDLTLSEAASLAAVTNSPTRYDPITSSENNRQRRNLILSEMQKQGMIAAGEAEAAMSETLTVIGSATEHPSVYNWYIETVLDDVIRDLMAKRGLSHEAAVKLVYHGGLSVYTLMDSEIQQTLESYFSEYRNLPTACRDGMQMGMTVMDSHTGDLLGIIGAVGEKTENRLLNYASGALRAPGSAIKPLSVYGPALEEGLIDYGSVFDDVPLRFIKNGSGYTLWPQNSPAVYSGLTDLPHAIAQSKNTVAVRVFEKLGAETSYAYMTRRLGFDTLVRSRRTEDGGKITDLASAPLALGQLSDGVSVRAMTAAYCALADGGMYHTPRTYVLVLDGQGKVLLENPGEEHRAFSETTACLLTELLRGVVENGTAASVRLDEKVDVAGKTGTSGESRDKWFIGYTPYLTAGIWCGYPDGNRSVTAGGPTHLEVWDAVMEELHEKIIPENEEPAAFQLAPGLVRAAYCRDSGGIPCEACRLDPRGNRVSIGLFVRGTEPKEACHCHIAVDYDTEGGGIACPSCPLSAVRKVGLLYHTSRDFPVQVYVTDAQFVYRPIESIPELRRKDCAFFAHTLSPGHYVGISKTQDGHQYNAWCCDVHSHAEAPQPDPQTKEPEYEDMEPYILPDRFREYIRQRRGAYPF